MPDSLLLHLNCSAMETAQIGMATRAQYSRHVPSRRTTVHTRANGLRKDNRKPDCSLKKISRLGYTQSSDKFGFQEARYDEGLSHKHYSMINTPIVKKTEIK